MATENVRHHPRAVIDKGEGDAASGFFAAHASVVPHAETRTRTLSDAEANRQAREAARAGIADALRDAVQLAWEGTSCGEDGKVWRKGSGPQARRAREIAYDV